MRADDWHRLARLVRQAPPEPHPEMPFGFDTRVVAGWRAQWGLAEAPPWAALLRVGLVCAAGIMLLSLAMTYRALTPGDLDELATADSMIQLSLSP
jgi:hypothetical protein